MRGIICEGDWVLVKLLYSFRIGRVVKVWEVAGNKRLVSVDFNAADEQPRTIDAEHIMGRLGLWGE